MSDAITISKKIAELVNREGGTAYYVGGFVRDRLMGIDSKDIDIEIHGISPESLNILLRQIGTPFSKGKDFGVFGLAGYDIDIAMPRKEKNTGKGHKDFNVYVDPFIGTYAASSRRDFTINALMDNILTGETVDHFNGREDLNKGVLRHVNDETFIEDPLRVYRCAQFAARFSFGIAPETLELCKRSDLSGLPRERVMTELEKALLKSDKPSVFFESLRQMNQLSSHFPELEKLIGIPQNPVFHPEGDVWNHTMLVIDEAAKLRNRTDYPLGFMLTAVFHDIGKPETTFRDETGRIRSIGHERCKKTAGIAIDRLTNESKLKKYILNMIGLHMRPNQLAWQKSSQKAVNKLLDEAVSPHDLILFAKADHFGRTAYAPYEEAEKYLKSGLEAFNEITEKPSVTGQDLIAAGLKPGKRFNELLKEAHRQKLCGREKQEILADILKTRFK